MKTIFFSCLSVAVIFLLFYSCQKEIHFDFISEGMLEKDVNNDCFVTLNGNYTRQTSLDRNNYAEVHVHVTAHGTYSIHTDTVNGYSFQAAGNFKDTGETVVKLTGQGKPITAGTDQFKVVYGASTCQFKIIVLNGSDAASFTLQGTPNACMIDTIMGGFLKGFATDTSDKVRILVNVTSPGSYRIASDTLNGYSFSSSGLFTSAGLQTVNLVATGIPLNEGVDVFTLKAGNSSCHFSNTVIAAVAVSNNDHFPLTMSSYWDYTDLHYQGNVVTNIIIGTDSKNGNVYKTMEEEISPGGPLILYYRKTSSDYFEYTAVDKYTGSFQYARKIYDDLPFLKEGLSTNEQWQSKEYNDTASSGQVTGLQYGYFCLDASATVIINGHAFANVYKVQMKPKIKAAGSAFTNTGEIYTYYYAKGVGLIYFKKENSASASAELQIKDWQVN